MCVRVLCVCVALFAKLLPDQRGAESVLCECVCVSVLVCVPALPQLQLLLLQVPLDSRRLLQRRSSALTLSFSSSLCLTVCDNWPSRLSYSSAFRCFFFFIHLHIVRYICSSMYICIAIGLEWVPTSVSAELSKRLGCISTFNLNWLFVASSSHIGFNL